MTTIGVRKAVQLAAVGTLLMASFAMAQSTSTSSGGWRRVGDPQVQTASQDPQISQSQPSPAAYPDSSYPQQQSAPPPNYPQQSNYPQSQGMQAPPPPQQVGNYQPVPAQVTLPAGTYLTVRVNQQLSSDHNQPGDAFSATLVRPVVANGVVLAEPGETIGGRVTQSQRAGRVEGLAKLGVELTDLTLVDGQNLPLKTTFVSRTGNSSVGRDVAGVASTTGLGAAIGAAADWGRGAAIGAGAGAAAGIIGVLVTRGEPSVIYPEQVLTFRLEQPLTVSTSQSTQAFRYVQPGEYNQPTYNQGANYGSPAPAYAYGPYGYPAYPYYDYPYYRGFSVFIGPGWGRGYYGGGRYYYRGGYRR